MGLREQIYGLIIRRGIKALNIKTLEGFVGDVLSLIQPQWTKACEWKQDVAYFGCDSYYSTACGDAFYLGEGTPEENLRRQLDLMKRGSN